MLAFLKIFSATGPGRPCKLALYVCMEYESRAAIACCADMRPCCLWYMRCGDRAARLVNDERLYRCEAASSQNDPTLRIGAAYKRHIILPLDLKA